MKGKFYNQFKFGNKFTKTPVALAMSLEQDIRDLETLSEVHGKIMEGGVLDENDVAMVNIVNSRLNTAETNDVISVESYEACVLSMEGIINELWRKVKNGIIKGSMYAAKYVEQLSFKMAELGSSLSAAIALGVNDFLYAGQLSAWQRLIGVGEFWRCYKWNDNLDLNKPKDKVISAAINEINNSVELFENYAKYVKIFHDGITGILPLLDDEKAQGKVVSAVEGYNSKTNGALIKALDKLLPTEVAGGQYSRILLGGKYIVLGDARGGNLALVDEEAANPTAGFKSNRHNLDVSSKDIKFTGKEFKALAERAKAAATKVDATLKTLKGLIVEVDTIFDKVDKATYESIYTNDELVLVRNFIRDVSMMVDTINAGAIMRYYEVFVTKLELIEDLVVVRGE